MYFRNFIKNSLLCQAVLFSINSAVIMDKVKKEKVKKKKMNNTDFDQKKFGESGINLLNLIAEILVEKALKSASGKGFCDSNQK